MTVSGAEVCNLPASSDEPWLWRFLQDELKPYPGRLPTIIRMVLAATLTMLVVMTMRSPNCAIGIFFSLTISRENPVNTLRHGLQTMLAFFMGLIYVLVGVTVFVNDSLGHFIFIALSLALMFFVMRTFKSHSAAFGFCFVVVSALPVWDLPFPVDAHVDNNIWSVFGVILSVCITIAVELLFCPRQTEFTEIQQGLNERLAALRSVLQVYRDEKDIEDSQEIRALRQLARLGASRLKGFLARSDMNDDSGLERAEWGALISVIERLVDTVSNLGTPQSPLTPRDQSRLRTIQSAFDNLQSAIADGQWPECTRWHFSLTSSQALPLLPQIERKLTMLPHVPEKSTFQEKRFRLKKFHWWQLFVADAFDNVDYLHFTVKGTLAGLACYVFFTSVDWHGLGNSLTTCVITALSTIGSSRQKQILRFAGAILGGVVLGIGSQIYILPWLDTIFGFTILFAAVTALAAWFTTSSPRLSFLGVQMALAFYLIMFQSSGMETSVLISRDFAMGTLLGLFAMWGIFDQLWAKPAIEEMKEAFAANLRHLSELNQTMFSNSSVVGKVDVLREQINGCFNKMSRNADMIVFEVGKQRAEHLYWCSRLEDWQNTQESLFLAQLAINHYHSNLVITEWPETLGEAFLQFNIALVEAWATMAACLMQVSDSPFRHDSLKKLSAQLQQEALLYTDRLLDKRDIHDLEAIIELEEQIATITGKLSQEILAA